jgi:hypothetical protein
VRVLVFGRSGGDDDACEGSHNRHNDDPASGAICVFLLEGVIAGITILDLFDLGMCCLVENWL